MRSFILLIDSAVAMASLLLAACTTVGSDYALPEPEMPESYLKLGGPGPETRSVSGPSGGFAQKTLNQWARNRTKVLLPAHDHLNYHH